MASLWLVLALLLGPPPAAAPGRTVEVAAHGTLRVNYTIAPPHQGLPTGVPATLVFRVRSDEYVDDPASASRGYLIQRGSFLLVIGGLPVRLDTEPLIPGGKAMFVLRDGVAGADGMDLSTHVERPVGVPLVMWGAYQQPLCELELQWPGTALASLDILDALGAWDPSGAEARHWSVADYVFDPLQMGFEGITLSVVADD